MKTGFLKILLFTLFFNQLLVTYAADSNEAESPFNIICFAQHPVVFEGDSEVDVKAIVVTSKVVTAASAINYDWTTDEEGSGTITPSKSANAIWHLSKLKLTTPRRELRATVTASVEGLGSRNCTINIVFAKEPRDPIERGTFSWREFKPKRDFILTAATQIEGGYGAYSYLLIGHEARDCAKEMRYVEAIRGYQAITKDSNARRDTRLDKMKPFDKTKINKVYVLLHQDPTEVGNQTSKHCANPIKDETLVYQILHTYDYAEAREWIVSISDANKNLNLDYTRGPYLVTSIKKPLSERKSETQEIYLVADFSSTQPDMVGQWWNYYAPLSATEPTWSKSTLTRVGLHIQEFMVFQVKYTVPQMKGLLEIIPIGRN